MPHAIFPRASQLLPGALIFLFALAVHADTAVLQDTPRVLEGSMPLRALSAPNVGDETNFHVDPAYDHKNRSSVSAVHQFTGERVYIYIDTAYLSGLAPAEKAAFLEKVRELLTEFDARIYPLVTQTFGTPWEPGIDNDLRISVLLTQLTEQTAGYFNPRDEFSRENVPDSNEREMIYLNTRFVPAGRAKMFLAHEFQHLITFYWKDKLIGRSDDVWLNELRSEYVPTLLGYDAVYTGSNLEHRVNTFLRNSADSLTEWKNTPYDYGPVALFGQYLADQYSANVFREMMRSQKIGVASIEDAFAALGKTEEFGAVFARWVTANYLNDISGDVRYGYLNSRLRSFRLAPVDLTTETSETALTIKDWSNTAYRFFGAASGTLTASITARETPSDARMVLIRMENGRSTVLSAGGGNGAPQLVQPLSPAATYLVIPFSVLARGDFKEEEPARNFTLRVAPVPGAAEVIVQPPLSYPEGSLIRARGDYKVYITKGQFKRHIVSAEIFKFYGHLGFASVIEISPEELAQYKLSAWVRADGDARVYEINGDGTKHWINMPGEQFAPSGRSWEGVYIINARERDYYKRGADVMK